MKARQCFFTEIVYSALDKLETICQPCAERLTPHRVRGTLPAGLEHRGSFLNSRFRPVKHHQSTGTRSFGGWPRYQGCLLLLILGRGDGQEEDAP